MKLPDFRTEEEETGFWKEHSISDYWEDLKEKDDVFKRQRLTPVTLKFDPMILKTISCYKPFNAATCQKPANPRNAILLVKTHGR